MAKNAAATRTPKAFPVGTKVKVHSLQKEGVVSSVPNFEERGVKIGGKAAALYPISDLSEVVESES